MKLLLTQDGDGGDWNLGWVASFDDEVAVGVDEVAAVGAAEKSLSDNGVFVKACSSVVLLLQRALAAWAAKLPVEGLLRFVRWCELVYVALDGSENELGVHLLEDGHEERVAEWLQ